jgi:hypothetical protein
LTPNPENWFEQEIVKVLSSVFIDPSPGSGLLKGEVDGDTKAFRSPRRSSDEFQKINAGTEAKERLPQPASLPTAPNVIFLIFDSSLDD